ncbi:MAG: TRAP transporter large permease, partial [Bradyrhizobium sp.]|nr:TRAP transporter large permease [Bradyrhizobium sp.]
MNIAVASMLLGMIALVMLNVPIAVALGLVAMAAIWIMQGAYMLPNTALVMFQGATDFPLLAVPLFV